MGSTSTPTPPAPIDPAQSGGEYLFGKDFSSYQGITDPALQDRLISSEGTYRPQYAALELSDIGTFARGLEERANPEYARIQNEIAGLRAGQEYANLSTKERKKALEEQANLLFPDQESSGSKFIKGGRSVTVNRENAAKRKAFVEQGQVGSGERAAKIAELETRLGGMDETLGATPGLFDLLEESSTRAAELQRSQLGLQRESDVASLKKFAPQVVQSYRDADPYSTGLAELATARAREIAGRGPSESSQRLLEMGLSESDLSPTEQEALLSQRGTEFAQSTGELTPLEQRRAQQSSRQASIARGRGMDQSALYGEMQSRMAQEMNKRERDIALGSQLIGQGAGLRNARLGQGAGFLTGSENIDLQRFNQEQAALTGAFGFNRNLAGDAGNIILGRPSAAIGLGQQTLGQAQQGASGQMGPQLFDMNAGINMALQQRGQDVTFQGMQAQADASRSAGLMGGLGSIAGGFLGRPL